MAKIGMLVVDAEFTHSASITEETAQLLRRRGHEIRMYAVENRCIDVSAIRTECDLYLLKPGSELLLSFAGILHEQGATIVNDFCACELVKDKVRVIAKLARSRLPVPFSFIAGDAGLVQRLHNTPVIIKDPRGGQGEGIHILHHDSEPLPRVKGGYFGQEYLEAERFDLKVYCVGDNVMATRRPFPCIDEKDYIGTPVLVENHIRDIALRVGRVLGLQIFGIDIVETESGPYVVDVNYFPSFVGVLGAAEILSDYIHTFATGKRTWDYTVPLAG